MVKVVTGKQMHSSHTKTICALAHKLGLEFSGNQISQNVCSVETGTNMEKFQHLHKLRHKFPLLLSHST